MCAAGEGAGGDCRFLDDKIPETNRKPVRLTRAIWSD